MSKTNPASLKPTLIGKCYIIARYAQRQAGNTPYLTTLAASCAEVAEELKRLAPDECKDDEER